MLQYQLCLVFLNVILYMNQSRLESSAQVCSDPPFLVIEDWSSLAWSKVKLTSLNGNCPVSLPNVAWLLTVCYMQHF